MSAISSHDPVRIGICGLGTVGYGSFTLLQNNREDLARRVGRDLVVTHVASRRLRQGQDVGTTRFSTDVFAVVDDPNVDIVLELLGGIDTALELVLRAIANGKHVVTANKALIAQHGNQIFAAATERNVLVVYEAAVAGGVPIIKAIREGLAGNSIQWVAGIINGTGNFILTEMREKNRAFADVLQEAQALGYAEADPTFDIEGIDAAHKLTILASIAFGVPLQFSLTYTEGISKLTQQDIRYADELGYRIKHLGISRRTPQGIELRVHPTFIDEDSLMANVNGVMNAVMVNGDAVGSTLYYGAGAGAAPTASAVVADIVDVVRVISSPQSSVPALAFHDDHLSDLPILPMEEVQSAYYLRITALDQVGVLSDITEILGDCAINIEAIIQKEPRGVDAASKRVPVIILTHEVREKVMNDAIAKIEALATVADKVMRIRVMRLDA
ncbi:MAG TPA: homoserine dehydrogenase [Hyphomicrobiales bacterium]|nr:homoserine dehydrogenase [Hyphomicrobiales bacterium]